MGRQTNVAPGDPMTSSNVPTSDTDPKVRSWFIAWLAQSRRISPKHITDETSVERHEEYGAYTVAALTFGIATITSLNRPLTVLDVVRTISGRVKEKEEQR